MSDYTKSAPEVLVDLINLANPQAFIQAGELIFGAPSPAPSHPTLNTGILATGAPDSRIEGEKTLYYDRLDLDAVLATSNATFVQGPALSNLAQLIGAINARYRLNLTAGDYTASAFPTFTNVDPAETLPVNLAVRDTSLIYRGSGQVMVQVDPDAIVVIPPKVRILGGGTVAEGDAVTAQVLLDKAVDTDTVIHFNYGGTATRTSDYTAPLTLTINAGLTEAFLPIFAIDDAEVEDPETIIITVIANDGYEVSETDYVVTFTLNSDDLAPPTVSISGVLDGDEGMQRTLVVYGSHAMPTAYTINLGYGGDARRDLDYTAPSTVVMPANTTSAGVTIALLEDDAVEIDETLSITVLAGSGYEVAAAPNHTTSFLIRDTTIPPVGEVTEQYNVALSDARALEQFPESEQTYLFPYETQVANGDPFYAAYEPNGFHAVNVDQLQLYMSAMDPVHFTAIDSDADGIYTGDTTDSMHMVGNYYFLMPTGKQVLDTYDIQLTVAGGLTNMYPSGDPLVAQVGYSAGDGVYLEYTLNGQLTRIGEMGLIRDGGSILYLRVDLSGPSDGSDCVQTITVTRKVDGATVFSKDLTQRFVAEPIPYTGYEAIRGVTLIPSTGEFAYGTTPATKVVTGKANKVLNVHNTADGRADVVLSIEQLEAQLPVCDTVSIVVAWFGDDQRAGTCTITPRLGIQSGDRSKTSWLPTNWSVAGVTVADAQLTSVVSGANVYGSTPSDSSLVELIQMLKARGKRIVFYPFLLMDIQANNTKPNPYWNGYQQANVWRGRVTCYPAPGVTIGSTVSPDGTTAAKTQIDTFFNGTWGFKRYINHYRDLCASAGGVDAFLIGSEMVGITSVRDTATTYAAIPHLQELAAGVKTAMPNCLVSYAADWSEYHSRQYGNGDLLFHLDALWADPNIDFVGIDNYLPIADVRSNDDPNLIYDIDYLKSHIEGGELYDFYYADRTAGTKGNISDGSYNKPWVYRQKDIRGWWGNSHINRKAYVETTATGWVPGSKPIWFTEYGCAAVNRGPNQPNVFVDPKSAESASPYFSTGATDPLAQLSYYRAMIEYWTEHGGDMIDPANMIAWTWDARPYPQFPDLLTEWSDGTNYAAGHWVQGRDNTLQYTPPA